jgi:hypothetical protein
MLVREKRRSPVSAPGEIGGEPDMWVEGGAFLAPALLASYHQWYLAEIKKMKVYFYQNASWPWFHHPS